MITPPECRSRRCRHLTGVRIADAQEQNEDAGLIWYCRAFPDGIPEQITYGTDKHLTKNEKQKNDLIYEKAGTPEERERVSLIGKHDPRER